MATIPEQNCTWCDNVESSALKCMTCRQNTCRQPRLSGRTWTMTVTPNRMFSPLSVTAGFSSVNNCCKSLTAFGCTTWGNACTWMYEASGTLKYQKFALQVYTIWQRWKRMLGGPGGTCSCRIGPIDYCIWRSRREKSCAQGYLFRADITSAKLYISRTQPRYTCTPTRCQYRLALVVEGRVGLVFATQLKEAIIYTKLGGTDFCGAASPSNCQPADSGSYPIPSPPTFNPALVSPTANSWRRVYRASVDDLTFPITMSASNTIADTCGPKCAETVTDINVTLGSAPSFACDGYPSVLACDNCWATGSPGYDPSCPRASDDCQSTCDPNNNQTWIPYSGTTNTEELRTDSGVVNSGSLPSFDLPDSFEVNLS